MKSSLILSHVWLRGEEKKEMDRFDFSCKSRFSSLSFFFCSSDKFEEIQFIIFLFLSQVQTHRKKMCSSKASWNVRYNFLQPNPHSYMFPFSSHCFQVNNHHQQHRQLTLKHVLLEDSRTFDHASLNTKYQHTKLLPPVHCFAIIQYFERSYCYLIWEYSMSQNSRLRNFQEYSLNSKRKYNSQALPYSIDTPSGYRSSRRYQTAKDG